MPSTLEGLKGLEQCSVVQHETDRYDYINTKYVLDMVLRCGGAIGVTKCRPSKQPFLALIASSITLILQTSHL